MKKFLSFFLLNLILIPQTFAFRDVPETSSAYDAVQYLIDNDYFEDGSFFRPDESVPASMFWTIVLNESGFETDIATFETPLPSNILEADPLAQYIRDAGRRGLISLDREFDKDKTISRLEAVRILNKIKGIVEPRYTSNQFLKQVDGIAPSFKGLPAFEAAFASGMIAERDLKPLRPHFALTRRELAQWLFQYSEGGERKSSLDPNYSINQRTTRFNYQRRQEQPGVNTEINTTKREPVRVNLTSTPVSSSSRSGVSGLPDGAVLQDVYQQVLQKYRFQTELTDEKKAALVNAGIAGFIKALDDKYSSYIEPERSQDFSENQTGKLEGIRAYVETFDDDFTITSPIKGSPAEKAGILPGDIVVEVDGECIVGESTSDIVKKIKGPAGTDVELTIRRDGANRKITVTRGKITVPSVEIEFKNSIPVISINQFGRTTAADFDQIIKTQVLPANPRGLVIDLRNNPGGFLTSAVDMGEYFVKKDQLIFTVDHRTTEKKYVSSRDGELSDLTNIVVLINKGSASASEILAGMLQDYDKATIMGSSSHGKGTVQELINYKNGGVLKLTVAKWLTPNGRWLQEGDNEDLYGNQPDIVVEDQTPEDRCAGIDLPLDQAVSHVLGRR